MLSKEYLKNKFPNLLDYEIYINTESPHYNCISYSIGRSDVWSWSKISDVNNYWALNCLKVRSIQHKNKQIKSPINNTDESKLSFDEFYLYHGFKPIEFDIRYNGNYKIALYGENNIPKHAAIQKNEIFWESKIGAGEIIIHDIFELEGGIYGDVIQIYEKKNI